MAKKSQLKIPAVTCRAEGPLRAAAGRRVNRESCILAAALEEFRACGFSNARLGDIALRAGVAKGTLYLYFDNKEELFKAAVRSLIHPQFEAMEREVANFAGSTEDLLRHAIKTMYTDLAHGRGGCELMRMMICEGHRMPELADFYYREIAARGLSTLRMIIWRGIALGEFRRSPAAEFPHLILAPSKYVSTWQMIFGDRQPLDIERYADAHIDFVLAALRV